jgi:hypothetical protein
MALQLVDTTELKQAITGYMATGYEADEQLTKVLMGMIDEHTVRCDK